MFGKPFMWRHLGITVENVLKFYHLQKEISLLLVAKLQASECNITGFYGVFK